jgi:ADP-heptose:LPS heptosyltransferase
VRKVAVLRANRLGDFVLTLPALEALKTAYPGAELTLLGLEWHREFVESRPGPVDRVVVVPPTPGVSVAPEAPGDESAVTNFFSAMVKERFDLALQLHGGGRFSNPFVKRLGARVTAGLQATDAPSVDVSLRYDVHQHEVLRSLELTALVGAPAVTLQPHLDVIERDITEAAPLLEGAKAPLVALHPGAQDMQRRWPAAKFAQVGDRLAQAGATVIVTGTEDETDLTDDVAGRMSSPIIRAAGRLSTGGLAALLSRCAVVVGNDTGPLHLARAVGTPTVTVYWAWNLMNAGPLSRRQDFTFVSWQVNCPVCGVNAAEARCEHDTSLVERIPVEPVAETALQLLQERS